MHIPHVFVTTHCPFVYLQKTQALADQAWEKVRMTGSLQQGLEKECADLRSSLLLVQREHDTLLTACALLAGALYPLHARATQLSAERSILLEHVARLDDFKAEVGHIC